MIEVLYDYKSLSIASLLLPLLLPTLIGLLVFVGVKVTFGNKILEDVNKSKGLLWLIFFLIGYFVISKAYNYYSLYEFVDMAYASGNYKTERGIVERVGSNHSYTHIVINGKDYYTAHLNMPHTIKLEALEVNRGDDVLFHYIDDYPSFGVGIIFLQRYQAK